MKEAWFTHVIFIKIPPDQKRPSPLPQNSDFSLKSGLKSKTCRDTSESYHRVLRCLNQETALPSATYVPRDSIAGGVYDSEMIGKSSGSASLPPLSVSRNRVSSSRPGFRFPIADSIFCLRSG